MPLSIYDSIDHLRQFVGREVAVSDWYEITQDRIDRFADVTEDHQWIHEDVERCRKESPFGSTIAHGFLTLSMIPHLDVISFRLDEPLRAVVNFGVSRVRFMAPVTPGSFIRMRKKLTQLHDMENGWQLDCRMRIEIRDHKNAALVADTATRLLR